MPATNDAQTPRSEDFVWNTQPEAARWVTRALDALMARNPLIQKLSYQLLEFTGTRLVDWIDHLALSEQDSLGLISELADVGYAAAPQGDRMIWTHARGMFPPIIVAGGCT